MGASIDYLASLAKTAVFNDFSTNFTGFTDFSAKSTLGLLEDSGILSKTVDLSEKHGSEQREDPCAPKNLWPAPIILAALAPGSSWASLGPLGPPWVLLGPPGTPFGPPLGLSAPKWAFFDHFLTKIDPETDP